MDKQSLSGWLEGNRHYLTLRIYYEDTDFSGIVYHANYLRFLERGRTDYLRLMGINQSTLFDSGKGTAFAVRSMTLDYIKPAVMDDIITVETQISEIRGASLVMEQHILRETTMLLSAQVVIVTLKNGRVVRIPDNVRALEKR